MIQNILIFIAPVVALAILLPVSRRQAYAGLKDDCFNRGIWIHDRLAHNEKPVDIAFLGSSRTINSVRDEWLTANLEGTQVLNLGYCRLGRNLQTTVLRDLFLHHSPKRVFLEVRETENRFSHPVFPYMATTRDVFGANPIFNHNLFSDAWKHLVYKVELTQDRLYGKWQPSAFNPTTFGFSSHQDTADFNVLESVALHRKNRTALQPGLRSGFNSLYGLRYLKRMKRLCEKNGAELTLLFLPGYGSESLLPDLPEHYNVIGPIIAPPAEIFESPDLWVDGEHPNSAGSRVLNEWLLEELESLESDPKE